MPTDALESQASHLKALDARLLRSLKKDVALLPKNESLLSKAMIAARRIDRVEIRSAAKYHGHTYYCLHVFYKTGQSNIPTLRSSGDVYSSPVKHTKPQTPDVVVLQRFSAFTHLRREMYYHAMLGHADECPCALCGNMVKLLEHSSSLPRLRVKLFSSEVVACAVLEKFVNDVIRLVADTGSVRYRRSCNGKEEIPMILYRFLFREEPRPALTLAAPSGVNCRSSSNNTQTRRSHLRR